ncbi:MAG: class I SAM-dependent methyltransferase [Actinomycetota bacterium]
MGKYRRTQVDPYKQAERDKRDRAAAGYEEWYRRTKGARFDAYERRLFDEAIRSPTLRVLDLGSGTGRIAETLARRTDVVALDISISSLVLNRRANRIPVVAADSKDLPFADSTFDAIVSCQVLQHLLPHDLDATLVACRRVLKRSGLLVFSVYNLHSLGNHGVRQRGGDSYGVRRWFSMEDLRELAKRNGFRVDRITGYKALPRRLEHVPGWDRADRWLAAAPVLGNHASRYLLATFRRDGS